MTTVSAVVGTISTLVALVISVTQFRWAAEERRERKRLALASAVRPASPAIAYDGAQGAIEFVPAPAAEPAPAPAEQPAEPTVAPPVAATKARRALPQTVPSRRLRPGDLVCGECGEGNPPDRKFCHRCGMVLEGAEAVKQGSPPETESLIRILLTPDHAPTSPRPRLWPLVAVLVLAVGSGVVLLLS